MVVISVVFGVLLSFDVVMGIFVVGVAVVGVSLVGVAVVGVDDVACM